MVIVSTEKEDETEDATATEVIDSVGASKRVIWNFRAS